MTTQQQLKLLINSILEESKFRKNPYFSALRNGSFAKSDFIETQIQFYNAVIFFSRPMAALAAKIPTPQLRVEVLRNIWDEHGRGDFQQVHGATFTELLKRIGDITPADIECRALWPEIRAFNTSLTATCVLDEYLTGVGLMGIIERMFAEISAWIGNEIVNRGWLTQELLIHYTLHEEIDVQHAEDFFAILEHSWGKSLEDKYAIEQGLRLGAYIFNRLYEDLYHSRTRRVFRQTNGVHSRAAG